MAKGYGATTLQEIVDRSEVTQGAFYHHFSRKEDVLYHIYEVFVTKHLAAAEAVTSADLSPSDAIVRLMEETARTVGEFRAYTSIIVGELRLINDESIAERFGVLNAKMGQIIELWRATVERGIASGEFTSPVADTRALAFALLGMPVFTYAWLDTTSPIGAEVGRGFGELALRGLLTTAKPQASRTPRRPSSAKKSVAAS